MALQRPLYTRTGAAATATESGSFGVQGCNGLSIDATVSEITGIGASITLSIERKGADGVWYTVWTGTALTAAGAQSITIGPGCEITKGLAAEMRLTWTIAGTDASVTFSASVWGF